MATHTSKVERRLQHEFKDRLAYFAGHPGESGSRLRELDREWDIERAVEANASTLSLAGLVFGARVDRRWLALSGLVAGFLLRIRCKDGARRFRCCGGSASGPPAKSTASAMP